MIVVRSEACLDEDFLAFNCGNVHVSWLLGAVWPLASPRCDSWWLV